jgi:hypothetical protein
MATTFNGNQAVESGYYLNASRWAIEPVAEDGGRLPAGPGTWRRIPTVAALLATPLLGLAFLMFLPFIGFALFAYAIVKKVTGGVKEGAADLAATLQPGWQPGEAHFTGKPGEEGAPGEKADAAAPTRELEALEKEIEAKRTGKS